MKSAGLANDNQSSTCYVEKDIMKLIRPGSRNHLYSYFKYNIACLYLQNIYKPRFCETDNCILVSLILCCLWNLSCVSGFQYLFPSPLIRRSFLPKPILPATVNNNQYNILILIYSLSFKSLCQEPSEKTQEKIH